MPFLVHHLAPALLLIPLAVSACTVPSGDVVAEAGAQAQSTVGDNRSPYVHADDPVTAGEYLVRVGGCNDCHTPGYNEAGGDMPVDQWLTGMPVGYRGPWGTTYPANLRLLAASMTGDQWVQMYSQRKLRPPMPWWALHDMSEADHRAMHAFIRSLGAEGEPAPAYVPPGREPETPFILMVPQESDG